VLWKAAEGQQSEISREMIKREKQGPTLLIAGGGHVNYYLAMLLRLGWD
jgi:hypothetical protein